MRARTAWAGTGSALLIPGSGTDAPATVTAGRAALSDSDRGFSITASHGVVQLPEDAEDAGEAARGVADWAAQVACTWCRRRDDRAGARRGELAAAGGRVRGPGT